MEKVKHRKTVIVLIMVAVCVWGVIIRRLINYTGESAGVKVFAGTGAKTIVKNNDSLRLDYRDPFFPGQAGKRVISHPVRQVLIEIPLKYEPPVFRIHGKIRKGIKDFLLVETGKENFLLCLHDKVDGFTITGIYDDSVTVKKGGVCYSVLISK